MSGFGHKQRPLGILKHLTQQCQRVSLNSSERLMRNRFQSAPSLFRKDFRGHFGCVNAIEFSNLGGEVIASGGDDRRVLVWNVEEGISGCAKAVTMKGEHHSNIFCLAFDNCNSKIFSGGNDEQVIVHDLKTGVTLDVYTHEDAVYGLSVDPLNDNVFASACDDGRILIYDIRAPPSEEPFVLANYMAQMHAVVYNPVEPRLLATANSTQGVGLWDVRRPRSCLLRYGGSLMEQSCMSVRINRTGDRVIALRRRLPPVLYDIHSAIPVYQFDHAGYYNSCTMKSCCFAGDNDQYLISGSDDFNLYAWKIPEEPGEVPWVGEAHLVLRGHRSIVNQVRFNPANHLIVSSGVEKVIKMWSPFEMPGSTMAPYTAPSSRSDPLTTVAEAAAVEAALEERPVYTQEEYYNLLLRSGQVISHDYSHQSLDEDPRMMAFFDALVQRELEGFSSDDDSLNSSSQIMLQFVQPSDSEVSVSGAGEHTLSDGSTAPSPRPEEPADNVSRVVSVTGQVPPENESNDLMVTSGGNVLNIEDEAPANGSILRVESASSVASAATSTNTLPGQRLLSTRPSISELITLKRKEYLSNARKVDQLIRRRQKRASRRATKRHTEILSTDSSSSSSSITSTSTSSSSSSSSSSGSESSSERENNNCKVNAKSNRRRARKRRKESSDNDDSSEEHPQGMSATAVADLRNKVEASKRAGFQRLKQIRTNSLLNNNNDANSDDGSRCLIASGTLQSDSPRVHNGNNGDNFLESTSSMENGMAIKRLDDLLQTTGQEDLGLSHNGEQTPSSANGAASSCTLQPKHELKDINPLNSLGHIQEKNEPLSESPSCTNYSNSNASPTNGLEEPSGSGVMNRTCLKFKRFNGKERSKRRYRRQASQDQSSGDEAL